MPKTRRSTLCFLLGVCAFFLGGANCSPSGELEGTGPGAGGGADPGKVDPPPPPCESLALSECEAAKCRLIRATRYEVDNACRHSTEPVACMPEAFCTQAISYAQDLEGGTWVLMDGCIPEGWEPFQAGAADKKALGGALCSDEPKPLECEKLSPEQCVEEEACQVVQARPCDTNKVCEDMEPVACIPADELCEEGYPYAWDEEGNYWQVQNECIPDGWVPYEPGQLSRPPPPGNTNPCLYTVC